MMLKGATSPRIKNTQLNAKHFKSRILHAAKVQEEKGHLKKALFFYSCIKDNDFAKSRIEALSPLKFSSVIKEEATESKTHQLPLKDILGNEEYAVFQAMQKIRTKKERLTRDGIVRETQLPKEKVFAALQGLQIKGYIGKIEKLYRYIHILEYPICRNGVIGRLQEEKSAPPKPVIFSVTKRALSLHHKNLLWSSDSSLESIESCSSPKRSPIL